MDDKQVEKTVRDKFAPDITNAWFRYEGDPGLLKAVLGHYENLIQEEIREGIHVDVGAAQAQANAQAALQAAEASAAALLADLEASDQSPAPTHVLPSPYAPGEGPRNPVSSVARPSAQEQFQSAVESTFKPVNLDTLRVPTNTSSHVVDFAQKIRDAQKFRGAH